MEDTDDHYQSDDDDTVTRYLQQQEHEKFLALQNAKHEPAIPLQPPVPAPAIPAPEPEPERSKAIVRSIIYGDVPFCPMAETHSYIEVPGSRIGNHRVLKCSNCGNLINEDIITVNEQEGTITNFERPHIDPALVGTGKTDWSHQRATRHLRL